MTVPPPVFAAAVMLFVVGLSYDPHILTVEWPGNRVSRDPATSPATCRAAADAWLAGRALPLNEPFPALAADCRPGNGFATGSEHIPGFNSPSDRR